MGAQQSQFVFEIRYKPNAKLLDCRGKSAESIAAHLGLPHWLIVENRLDVFDAEQTTRLFVSFRNAGYVQENPPTNHFFSDNCVKAFKFISTVDGFESPLSVERLGIRLRALTPFLGSMTELVNRYKARYYGFKSEAETALDGELVDIGGALNFKGKFGNFNTNGGPMPAEQAKSYFPKALELPDVGLFMDIDYWTKPNKAMTTDEITKTIRQFSTECIQKHARVADLILGDPPHGEQWIAGATQVGTRPNA
ncbi:MAG: hypothetical protein LAO55_02700 [Acidobacteriia bacterium]|nr:hypothetical protein [Terriglobia bacterium]